MNFLTNHGFRKWQITHLQVQSSQIWLKGLHPTSSRDLSVFSLSLEICLLLFLSFPFPVWGGPLLTFGSKFPSTFTTFYCLDTPPWGHLKAAILKWEFSTRFPRIVRLTFLVVVLTCISDYCLTIAFSVYTGKQGGIEKTSGQKDILYNKLSWFLRMRMLAYVFWI